MAQEPTVTGVQARDGGKHIFPCGTGATTYILAFTGTSAPLTLAGTGMALLLISTTACYIGTGSAAADANDWLLPAYTPVLLPIAGLVRLDVLRVSASGNLHVLEIT